MRHHLSHQSGWRGLARGGVFALLSVLAGCGGGGNSVLSTGNNSSNSGTGTTRRYALTQFDVDVASGKVTVTAADSAKARSRAILTGGAISFNSSDLISVPGDAGKRLVRIRMSNNSGESIGSNARLVIGNLQNKGTLNLRTATTVANFAGDGGTTDRDGYTTAAGVASPRYITAGTNASTTRLFFTTATHTVRTLQLDGTVSTYAGQSGTPGFVDATGTNARFRSPGQIAADANGNLYVADTGNHAIRRISLSGEVVTIAGVTGTAGSTDGTGNQAKFSSPVGITVTPDGNRIYVADTGNHTIRLLAFNNSSSPPVPRDVAGAYTVTTIAGAAGGTGFADGYGNSARLNGPTALAFYSSGFDGNDRFYVTDTQNNAIRLIQSQDVSSTSARVFTVGGGSGAMGSADGTGDTATFNRPTGLEVQPGNGDKNRPLVIVIGDTNNHRLRLMTLPTGGDLVTASDHKIVTLAGDGTAGNVDGDGTVARFNGLQGIGYLGGTTASSTLYIADTGNNRIRKVNFSTATLSSGGADSAITEPVRVVNGVTEIPGETAWVRPVAFDDANGTEVQFYVPQGVSGFSFTAYVELDTGLVNLPAVGASYLTTLAGDSTPGTNNGPGKLAQFNHPLGITAVPSAIRDTYKNNSGFRPRAFIADQNNSRIRYLDENGNIGTFVGAVSGFADGQYTGARLSAPADIAFSYFDGNLYVADAGNKRVRRIGSNGTVTTIAGTGVAGSVDGVGSSATFDSLRGITVDGGGTIFVSDSSQYTIRKIQYVAGDPSVASSYLVTTIAGAPGAAGSADGAGGAARFNVPTGMSVDTDGKVYVADALNHTIRVLARNSTGNYTVSTLAGAAGTAGTTDGAGTGARFNTPISVTLDSAHNLYVADYGSNRIRRVSPQGAVVTLMGANSGFANGANGLLNGPGILSVEEGGTLLICDYNNNAIRALQRLITDAQNL